MKWPSGHRAAEAFFFTVRSSSLTPLLVICGPTGVGKTHTALRVAEKVGGEIISADSRQIYRKLDIGTAKPTSYERRRVPHHLVDVLDPSDSFSAGEFGRRSRQFLESHRQQGAASLLVGGSGMYIEATVDGLGTSPATDEGLRARLEVRWAVEGGETLYEELTLRDPVVAWRLHSRDRSRILRALELCELTGKGEAPPAEPQRLGPIPIMIALDRPRDQLHHRIEHRIRQMVDAGWVEEVRALLAEGVSEDCPGMESLGYQELVAHLQGRMSLPEALAQIARRTRQYAKRQITWLRRDRRFRWLDLGRFGQAGAVDRIVDHWHRRIDAVRVDSCT